MVKFILHVYLCIIYVKAFCRVTGEICKPRMNGFRVFLTPSEDTSGEVPVYTCEIESPGPVITVPLEGKVGRYCICMDDRK